MPPAPGRPRDRRTALVLLAVAAALAAWGNVNAWTQLATVNAGRHPVAAVMLAAGTASVPLLGVALLRLRRRAPPAGALLRWSFCAAVVLWCGYVAFAGTYHRPHFACLVGCWSAAVAALVAWLPPSVPGARPRPLGELLLRAVAALRPSPLFVRGSASSAQRLRAHAYAPGELHFGFACNARGFYDAPFRPRAQRPLPAAAVAVIGDSFSASFVPHEFHYTTVAERQLGAAELWNVGWAALGPAEYRLLLRGEVLPLDPDAVIVSLFLGNDLLETRASAASDRVFADWFDRGNVLLVEVPRRLCLLSRGGPAVPQGQWTRDRTSAAAWLHDPLREPGSIAEREFLRIETERAQAAGAIEARRWDAMTVELLALRADAGARPLGFVLIPDEFMVEDALWQRVQARAGVPLDRHALRLRLVAWCRDHGIPCLDLWPALTAVPPLADGDRHLYLKRDTHWNVRGNEVAGAALAPFVRALLGR
jgi:hypothetical protein